MPAPVRLRMPSVNDSPAEKTSYIGSVFSSVGRVLHCRSESCTDCVPMMWNAMRSTVALVWSVPMPYSVNFRAMGTVKMIARGASEFAPTSVTLFCAMRSGLPGDCSANSMSHTPLWREDALDDPNIHVAGRKRAHSDNHRADLQRQLVVRVEVHVREVVDVRIERVGS